MKLTANYTFRKPEGYDYVKVDDFNENFDALDRLLKYTSDELNKKVNATNGILWGDSYASTVGTEMPGYYKVDSNGQIMIDESGNKLINNQRKVTMSRVATIQFVANALNVIEIDKDSIKE